jgi:hypothetical protein
LRGGLRFRDMPTKPARNLVDSAVPKSAETHRLSEGEKKAMELGEQAEHSHGAERERLQKEAKKAAERGGH